MGIGYRIKEARERLNLTQTELGKKVGVTGSAITNYEKETSHPKEQIIYKLMEVLRVDANYLFQDCMPASTKNTDVSISEYELIQKYRDLDYHGKKMVNFTLENEWDRSTKSVMEGQVKLFTVNDAYPSFVAEDQLNYEVNAAHARTDQEATDSDLKHDNDIMDDENF